MNVRFPDASHASEGRGRFERTERGGRVDVGSRAMKPSSLGSLTEIPARRRGGSRKRTRASPLAGARFHPSRWPYCASSGERGAVGVSVRPVPSSGEDNGAVAILEAGLFGVRWTEARRAGLLEALVSWQTVSDNPRERPSLDGREQRLRCASSAGSRSEKAGQPQGRPGRSRARHTSPEAVGSHRRRPGASRALARCRTGSTRRGSLVGRSGSIPDIPRSSGQVMQAG